MCSLSQRILNGQKQMQNQEAVLIFEDDLGTNSSVSTVPKPSPLSDKNGFWFHRPSAILECIHGNRFVLFQTLLILVLLKVFSSLSLAAVNREKKLSPRPQGSAFFKKRGLKKRQMPFFLAVSHLLWPIIGTKVFGSPYIRKDATKNSHPFDGRHQLPSLQNSLRVSNLCTTISGCPEVAIC